MRETNITVRIGTLAGRVAASVEASDADRGQARLADVFAAPQKRGTGRRAKSLNPMPWCKPPAASTFGKLCTEQLKAYKVKTTGA